MIAWRLVNSQHDPIEPGQFLTRPSDHSNQKLGVGMYFSPTVEALQTFLDTHHGHTYTHILECDIIETSLTDFLDLRPGWQPLREPPYRAIRFPLSAHRYCQDYSLKGVIWTATAGWVEVVLFSEHINGRVRIVSAKALSSSTATT